MVIDLAVIGKYAAIIAAAVIIVLIFKNGFKQNSKLHGSDKSSNGSSVSNSAPTQSEDKK